LAEEHLVAYAIKYERPKGKRVRVEWISEYGDYVTPDIDSAERFGKRESAETRALLLAAKDPNYIGRLSVVVIVVGDRKGDVRWREKKEV
jgi:hypothetical protein